jgi:4-hydroxy-tetrahydrodipicolinate synthase
VAQLCAAWKKGDVSRAREIHQKMFSLVKALFIETNPIPIKTAMGWMDLCGPELRLPLAPMEKANAEKLETALRAQGLLAKKRQHAGC